MEPNTGGGGRERERERERNNNNNNNNNNNYYSLRPELSQVCPLMSVAVEHQLPDYDCHNRGLVLDLMWEHPPHQ